MNKHRTCGQLDHKIGCECDLQAKPPHSHHIGMNERNEVICTRCSFKASPEVVFQSINRDPLFAEMLSTLRRLHANEHFNAGSLCVDKCETKKLIRRAQEASHE